ncbi:aminotransferase class IV [Flavilitoribacter nigricans]|uniref:branched-chain-amino-acid transaminase n=1 Tax=Flavilitoribacter nigricans (strain ATCC 23147 / DSM 23189 / NBRC 102662 / NCIMB 1420 / SS-2) TaxID=1122177 RepID=A0A2D0MY56_FLAN2|nr:aminotransferase class IV [Flavilitoribacter nigricans]PHN01212.1 amino acid aminotransferase [Flavilitoribacter nigricans DSM 23189 = NBRC 102662]
MIRYYNLNGKLTEVARASLQVSDLAILRGFGIFDYFLVKKHQPLFLADYLDRFYNSAEKLGLSVPVERSEMTRLIRELIAANGLEDAGIRLVMTGGYAADSYTPVAPNLIIMQHEFKAPPAWQYDQGIRLMAYDHQRELPEIKSINYLTGIRLQPTLKAQQADYLLYHDQGVIRESDRSNFFGLTDDGILVTPDDKILRGITRKQILQLAADIVPVEEREMGMDEIPRLKEAFLTSSTKGVMPVVQIDDQPIGDGRPGDLTYKLGELFQELVGAYRMV